MKIIFPLFYVALVFGCTDDKTTIPVLQPNTMTEKKISVRKAGELHFRRSYNQGESTRELSATEYEKIKNSNPSPIGSNDEDLTKKFQELKLVDEKKNLVRSRFKFAKKKDFELIDQNGRQMNCRIISSSTADRHDTYDLVVVVNKQQGKIEIVGNYGLVNDDIKYLLYDVIPGGYPEIIILNEYYIMMGDNSDIYIYEVSN